MGLKGGGAGGGQGEIVQVQGGHIIRATGRKDRHSKVYTAKGPRDRRVRLSAHTAIQFYDVQDRLGYDRPSKAVDWLIKKAKSAIDKLAELPPWNPTADAMNTNPNGSSGDMAETSGFQLQRQIPGQQNDESSFIPAPMDSDTIGDTMKSFFLTSSASSSMNFESYPSGDLGLSLHSFQEQNILHGQSQGETSNVPQNNDQNLFLENNFHRMVAWNNSHEANRGGGGGGGGGGFIFYPPPLQHQHEALVGHQGSSSSSFSQRGTLQSSFAEPPIRAWDDLSFTHQKAQTSIFGSRFGPDGLPGFCVPGQIHGQEDQHGVVSNGPFSSSPSSHH